MLYEINLSAVTVETKKRKLVIILDEKIGLNIQEAAKMLGISKQLMTELTRQKGFPCIRFKRRIVINKKDLLEWFAKNSNSFVKY